LFFHREVRDRAPQLSILALQIFEFFGLLDLQAALLLPPAIEGLIGDPGVLGGLRYRLALAHQHFDLPKFGHNLLSCERLFWHFPVPFCFQSLNPTGTENPGQVKTTIESTASIKRI
jgi:hypothetical protein